jgi:phage gpG-like protein
MDNVTITGVNRIIEVISSIRSPVLRKKLLRKSAAIIVKNSKNRIDNSVDLQGRAWASRSEKTDPSKKRKKMERGLRKRLIQVFVNDKTAVVGFRKPQERMVAAIQQKGFSKVFQVSRANPNRMEPATKTQAQSLQRLGYKVNSKRVTIAYITTTLTQGKAGLIIKSLENSPKKTSYRMTLPPRSFLGITNQDSVEIMSIIRQEIAAASRGGNNVRE